MARDDAGGVFREKDCRRIARAVRRVEGEPPTGGGGPGASGWGWNPGVMRARVVSPILPGNMLHPGTGYVRLWGLGEDGLSWEESEDDAMVYNDHAFPAAVAVDKAVKVAWIGLELWLIQADCP